MAYSGGEYQTFRLEYKEEKCLKAFFKLMPLRGAAQKRPGCGPLLTLRNQRKYPLDTPIKFSQKLRTILPI